MTENIPFSEPLNFIGSKPPIRKLSPKWPWELSDNIKGASDFLREHICEPYLVKIIDPNFKLVSSYKLGYNLVQEGEKPDDQITYGLRASCLTKSNRTWVCNFGNTQADYILFFGFRKKEKPLLEYPILEFCLKLPRAKFSDRNHISILDDDYHIKGFSEFSLDSAILDKMQYAMIAINNHDELKLMEICPISIEGKSTRHCSII